MAGSGCCAPDRLNIFDGLPGGGFAPRREVRLVFPGDRPFRDVPRPTLVDWDRDGHADVLIRFDRRNELFVARGPVAGKEELALRAIENLPGDPSVAHCAVADWDGDGSFDLLVGIRTKGDRIGRGGTHIVWFRNRTTAGEPAFDEPRTLLTVPDPWRIDGFDVWFNRTSVPAGLVVGVNDWQSPFEGGYANRPVTTQLRRYRVE